MRSRSSGMMNSDSDGDFGFAFNNVHFSDRLLRIEITRGGEFSCSSIVDWVPYRTRRRKDVIQFSAKVLGFATCQVESDLIKDSRESNCENDNDKHEVAMVTSKQKSESGGEDENESHYCGMRTTPSVLRVIELHISSPILAVKSPFFYKLFSNGMLESEEKHLTLKIDASEEAAVMELLIFIYRNSLSTMEVPALLDVLMAADKFEVASCMKYCSHVLVNMPMTVDSAFLILELPSSVLMADPVKPLTNAARQFLTSRYKDITKFPLEKVMLAGIKALLASNDLMIAAEDIVYEVILKWEKPQYSVVEKRKEIFDSHLARYIRFPHMTCRRLRRILTSDDFKPSVASKLVLELVLEALIFKAQSMPHRRSLTV